jgi:Flp pilus assembly protein TadD
MLLVFLLALAVRLLYLIDSADLPTFHQPIVDAETYDAMARSALANGRFSDPFFWQPFFYPAFLVFIYAGTGGSLLAAKLAQLLVGSLTCVLIARLARRLQLSPRATLAAGLIGALYGPLLFYDAELLSTTWAAFWAIALVVSACDARDIPSPRHFLVFGLVAGFSILTFPPFVPVTALVAAWLLWPRPSPPTPRPPAPSPRLTRLTRLLHAATLAAGLLLVTLPVAMLNRHTTGNFSCLPYSGGINLYIGNNPTRDLTLRIRPGWEWDNLTLLPARYGIPPGPQTSRFFNRQVFAYVRQQPVHFLRGLATKTIQFFSPRELPRNVDLYVLRDWSVLMQALVWRIGDWGFPFGILLPLAAIGLWSHRRRLPFPLAAMLILYPAAVILVFPSARYRTPIIPLMIPTAVAGLLALADWRRNRPRTFWAALASGALASALLAIPGPFPQEQNHYRAEMFYCLGGQQLRNGLNDDAIRLLQTSLDLEPGQPDALNSMGLALERTGKAANAEDFYRKAVAANPRNLTARTNLAGALYRRQDYAAAETVYRQAADLAPRNAMVRQQLAMCLIQQNRMPEAIAPLYEALEIDPNDAPTHNNLGSALNHTGQISEALKHFQAAILLDPNLDIAIDNLGAILEGQKRITDAAVLYRAALERATAQGRTDRANQVRRQLDLLRRFPPQPATPPADRSLPPGGPTSASAGSPER